ncbi:MAG: carboxylesterase family protein [Acidobacteria bacterium]|nr:carboxylesterase family protein [Acidobacteriota bacterium]
MSGKARGYTDGGIYTFKGIPFAGSTEGRNRFVSTNEAAPWAGIRDSMIYGPVCPPFNHGSGQSFHFERQFAQESEDCLRINIWTPGINDNRFAGPIAGRDTPATHRPAS